jgi:hypothetical protein
MSGYRRRKVFRPSKSEERALFLEP